MVVRDSIENEPQINADERRFNESVSIEKDCLGISTHGAAMRVCGVENPQGFGSDERRLNALSEEIIGCAFEVSNVLGAGFLEKVYENALNIELNLRGLKSLQQAPLKVYYKNELVGDYIADILVENEIIIEVKAVKELDTIHTAQCLNYLKITGLKLCLLFNFSKPRVEIKRIVNGI
ncbi:PD-(D/E)XK nuclease superfamily protein [uncultured archaeon]|nr:PD-(D/E)XK nuclease superfamily protein [uncultured archaeon]